MDCLRSNPRLRLIPYRKNVGKWYALRLGFNEVTKDIMVFLDSDSDINTTQIRPYVDILQRCEMIIASKRHPR